MTEYIQGDTCRHCWLFEMDGTESTAISGHCPLWEEERDVGDTTCAWWERTKDALHASFEAHAKAVLDHKKQVEEELE